MHFRLWIAIAIGLGTIMVMEVALAPRSASAADPTLFCVQFNWVERDFPYGSVMIEQWVCSSGSSRAGVPVGEIGELGVCNVRPSFTPSADYLNCRWQGYYDWPEDIADRMYATAGQYACLITDHWFLRGEYFAAVACGERLSLLRAVYGR